MSLGGEASELINNAVSAAIDAGIVFVVSAGNDGGKACSKSPASCAKAITVSAVDTSNSRPYYANYGACVDIFGPGSDITSAWASTSTATNTLTGTSMATPHAAGVAAMYLERDPSMTPAEVKAAMLSDGIPDVVSDPGNYSPNILLTTREFFGSSTSAVSSPSSSNAAITPAPTPMSESDSLQIAECYGLLQGCKADSDCCAGSCWLANLGFGFCAFSLD